MKIYWLKANEFTATSFDAFIGFVRIANNTNHPSAFRLPKGKKRETHLRLRKGNKKRRLGSRSWFNPIERRSWHVAVGYRYELSQSHPARVSIRSITMNPRKSLASRMRRHAFHQLRSHTVNCPRSVDIIAYSSHVRVFLSHRPDWTIPRENFAHSNSTAYKGEKCCTVRAHFA